MQGLPNFIHPWCFPRISDADIWSHERKNGERPKVNLEGDKGLYGQSWDTLKPRIPSSSWYLGQTLQACSTWGAVDMLVSCLCPSYLVLTVGVVVTTRNRNFLISWQGGRSLCSQLSSGYLRARMGWLLPLVLQQYLIQGRCGSCSFNHLRPLVHYVRPGVWTHVSQSAGIGTNCPMGGSQAFQIKSSQPKSSGCQE
jgi:hypothetical protein